MKLTKHKEELKGLIRTSLNKIDLDTTLNVVIDEVATLKEIFKFKLPLFSYTLDGSGIVVVYELVGPVHIELKIKYAPEPVSELYTRKLIFFKHIIKDYYLQDNTVMCNFKKEVDRQDLDMIEHLLLTYAESLTVSTRKYGDLYESKLILSA